uniref:Uncharacterized protein n=5 Tax=Aegilops tauschii subsp. strangulata TaxID=200361 RepID=A0A453RA07_AEGTS
PRATLRRRSPPPEPPEPQVSSLLAALPSTALIFKPKPRRTLSPPRRWKLLFNEEGCLDAAGMIMRVQRGVSYIYLSFITSSVISSVTYCIDLTPRVG